MVIIGQEYMMPRGPLDVGVVVGRLWGSWSFMVAGSSDKLRSHAPCEAQYYIRVNIQYSSLVYFVVIIH